VFSHRAIFSTHMIGICHTTVTESSRGLASETTSNVRVCLAFPATLRPLSYGRMATRTRTRQAHLATCATDWSACLPATLHPLTRPTAPAASPPRIYANSTPAPSTKTPSLMIPMSPIARRPMGHPVSAQELSAMPRPMRDPR
jgi:hypothetical protein